MVGYGISMISIVLLENVVENNLTLPKDTRIVTVKLADLRDDINSEAPNMISFARTKDKVTAGGPT